MVLMLAKVVGDWVRVWTDELGAAWGEGVLAWSGTEFKDEWGGGLAGNRVRISSGFPHLFERGHFPGGAKSRRRGRWILSRRVGVDLVSFYAMSPAGSGNSTNQYASDP